MQSCEPATKATTSNVHAIKKAHAMPFLLVLALLPVLAGGQQTEKKDCPFLSSLHYTARGMGHWYDKNNGGLETITGVPYSELSCKNCHAASCDDCHRTEIGGKAAYSTAVAKGPSVVPQVPCARGLHDEGR